MGVKTTSKEDDIHDRFKEYGLPPKKNGDYAFLLHIIKSLKSTGKGACILPHGVLFRGNAEAEIRKNIIAKKYIKGIIGLPPNLFYGTGIPACIIVIDKENATERTGIFMIDAGKGFIKDGNKNRLREKDLHRIVDVFNKQSTVKKYARLVLYDEIERNEFNLNIPRYIDSQETEDVQDIEAHLLGDIPAKDVNELEEYWTVYPTLKTELFGNSKRKNPARLAGGYVQLKLEKEKVKQHIFNHSEFLTFSNDVDTAFAKWKTKNTAHLKTITAGIKPKETIHKISEDILYTFANRHLLDNYDVYQHLMDYWNETMQDDCYIIAADGWKAELEIVKQTKKETVFDCDLVPKQLVINRYFATEKTAIEKLETEKENIIQQRNDLEEEYSGEGDTAYFAELDKVNKANVQERIKELKGDKEATDELKVLNNYLQLLENESSTNKKIKTAKADLDKKVIEKYPILTEAEIKQLVVDDKWMAVIESKVKSEMERISQRLTQRIKELAERYETTLPQLTDDVKAAEEKVNAHLKQMEYTF